MNFNLYKVSIHMLLVFIFAPCFVQFQHPVLLQTMRCESNALDMTGVLLARVLDVIIVRVITDRTD